MRESGVFALLLFVSVALSADPAACCRVGPGQSTLARLSCAGDSWGCPPTMQSLASDPGSSLTFRAPAIADVAQMPLLPHEQLLSFRPEPDRRVAAAPAFFRSVPLLV